MSRNELGKDIVHQYVGQEPSGLMFNELSLDANGEKSRHHILLQHPNSTQYTVHILDKPHNPLVNSGAIMSAAILLNVLNPQKSSKDKFDFVTEYMKVCLEEFQSL